MSPNLICIGWMAIEAQPHAEPGDTLDLPLIHLCLMKRLRSIRIL